MNVIAETEETRILKGIPWKEFQNENVYRCRAFIEVDEDGAICSYAPELPGAASQGDTEAEAIENLRGALQGVIRSYLDDKEDIPWEDETVQCPPGTREFWITVNV